MVKQLMIIMVFTLTLYGCQITKLEDKRETVNTYIKEPTVIWHKEVLPGVVYKQAQYKHVL